MAGGVRFYCWKCHVASFRFSITEASYLCSKQSLLFKICSVTINILLAWSKQHLVPSLKSGFLDLMKFLTAEEETVEMLEKVLVSKRNVRWIGPNLGRTLYLSWFRFRRLVCETWRWPSSLLLFYTVFLKFWHLFCRFEFFWLTVLIIST